MKILSAKQLGKVDQLSMKWQSISSWELMERASKQAVEAILYYLKKNEKCVHIFCGIGNNGGDGLAIAYYLDKLGYSVQVYKVAFADKTSNDFELNAKRLHEENIKLKSIQAEDVETIEIDENEIVIDAIFGVGLNRRMPAFVEDLAVKINQSKAFCFSIDIPSGMFIHQAIPDDAKLVQPDICLTFQLPKLALLLPETGKYVPHFQIVPIGLSQEAIENEETEYHFIDLAFVQKLYQPRKEFSHKGTYGHALLIGGQKGMLGSVLLASKAALKSGVGKLSVMLPNLGHSSLHTYLPEAMALENPSENYIHFTEIKNYNSIGIGVGIGKTNEAFQALKSFLEGSNQPMLLDADALNLIAENSALLQLIPKNSILTPHPGELKRLIGNWKDDFEKLEKVKNFAKKQNCILVVKGKYSCICDGENFYFNSTGNSGMATAGSGDVLSGIITSLLAQAYSPLQAAQLGVYIHGLAGDLALKQESKESLMASDIIQFLGEAFKNVNK
ncbi:NAD(P)H-hydrate dehydratase [Psychroflexus planctonicus]|uniref:Bifunctional NAD(P)H-hydrate repair enzyme n=1 Tax=Psychroflexus planctonicus TaxID=1526575 RepID=A0ABQ1SKD8_9FLAO|nr:NAD(P)H-hydrate dehydratase [Psychroflexus planctonicus]GGE43707.1 bifunctional NAD(P)H-hydrate repair enzyme [Psychroflexus planctonicus]